MSELAINRKNTVAFIAADPLVIVLSHRDKVPNKSGGHTWSDPVLRDPQTFRLIPQSDIMPSVQTPDGFTLTPTYVLLGAHDVIMARWDTFELNGVKFMLVSPVRPDFTMTNVYERKADVARL